jgi:hypothetical protein
MVHAQSINHAWNQVGCCSYATAIHRCDVSRGHTSVQRGRPSAHRRPQGLRSSGERPACFIVPASLLLQGGGELGLHETVRASCPHIDALAGHVARFAEISSGKVEGTVNKIKMLKRQMYGRATFGLLRTRVILHPA